MVREESPLSAGEAVKGEPIPQEADGKRYKVVTRDWMYQGHDGYETLMGKHCLVDDESGMPMSTVVRKFLLGAFSGGLCLPAFLTGIGNNLSF